MENSVACPNPDCRRPLPTSGNRVGIIVCTHCGKSYRYRSPAGGSRSLGHKETQHDPEVSAPTKADAGPAVPSRLQDAPKRIGRFEVRARLGSGAFGTVYRAYDPQLDREVALKVPQAGTLDGKKTIERFLREAKAAARLRHPHIVAVHESGFDGEHYYIAAEFIAGKTLAHASEDRALPARQAVQIVRELAEALYYAHEMGIVHRDVKSANVMVDEQGKAHLMDFGLAHRHDVTTKLTRAGAVLGTPAYMAPEQAVGQSGKPLPASDQYSLGVVLYELLCGRLPFEGPAQIVLFNVIQTEPTSPRQVDGKVPLDLETICLKAMAKRPQDRYGSCRELADDLRRWLDDEPIRARRVGMAERLARWARRNPIVASLGALAALCLVGAAVAASVGLAMTVRAQSAQANRLQEQQARLQEQQARLQAEKAASEALLRQQEAEAEGQRQKRAHEAESMRQAADKAQREKALAEERRRRFPYAADMRAAYEAWEHRDFARVNSLLERHRPAAGEDDLRGFEWYYLRRAYRQSAAAFGRHSSRVTALAFAPSGDALAYACADGSSWLWSTSGDKRPMALSEPGKRVRCVAISPDGKTIFTGGDQGVRKNYLVGAELNDVASQQVFPNPPNLTLHSLGVSFDGKLIFAVYNDRSLRVVDASEGPFGKPAKVHGVYTLDPLSGDDNVNMVVAFARDGRNMAFGSTKLVVLDVLAAKPVPVPGYSGKIDCLALSDDGKTVAVGSDKSVKILDAATGNVRLTLGSPFLGGLQAGLTTVAFSADGRRVAAGGNGATVLLWDAATGRQLATVAKYTGAITAVAFSPDGKRLASSSQGTNSSSEGGISQVSDIANLQDDSAAREVTVLPDLLPGYRQLAGPLFQPRTVGVAFTSDDRTLLAAGEVQRNGQPVVDLRIWQWDAARAEPRSAVAKEYWGMHAAVFSPDGKTLAAVVRPIPDQLRAGLWDVATAKQISRLDAQTGECTAVAFSADGQWLAVGSNQQVPSPGAAHFRVGLAHLATGQFHSSQIDAHGENASLHALAFAPDGKTLATGHADGAVRLWETSTGKALATLKGHQAGVISLAFATDGKILASGSLDGNVKLWDTATGQVQAALEGHSEEVRALTFSRDGKSFATGSKDGTVRLWDPLTGQLRLTLSVPRDPTSRHDFGKDPAGKLRQTVPVNALALSADGRSLAAALADETVRLWRGATDAQAAAPSTQPTSRP